jgi:hypothetical protein
MIETAYGSVSWTSKEAADVLGCPRQSTTRQVRRIVDWLATSYGGPGRWAKSERADRAMRGYLEGLMAAAQLAMADPQLIEDIVRMLNDRSGPLMEGRDDGCDL